METPSGKIASPHAEDDFGGLDCVLEAELLGSASQSRFDRLLLNLVGEGAAQSAEVLRLIGDRVDRGELSLKDGLVQFAAASDVGRWPIFVVRPGGSASKVEARFLGLGLSVVATLASAYRLLGLIPVRIPPSLSFLKQLARRPDIQRIERSWAPVCLPDLVQGGADVRRDPQRLVDDSLWPEGVAGVRQPIEFGIVDTGIDARHGELQRTLLDQRAFRQGEERIGDRVGHGTAVAGIIHRICPSARFLSAKVMNPEGVGNLDDLVRALGWFKRTTPDVLVCSALVPSSLARGSILGGLLQSFVDSGVIVVLPAAYGQRVGNDPVDAIWVGAEGSVAPGHAKVLAVAGGIRVPRSVNADKNRFRAVQPPGWAAMDGVAVSTAFTAACAGLLIRAARNVGGRQISGQEIVDAIQSSSSPSGALSVQGAVDKFLAEMNAPHG